MIVGQHGSTKLDLFDDRAEIELAEHSAVIKALGKRVVADVIEIGARLTECKRICGHGNWLPWLDREFGWSEDTAENYIAVHNRLGSLLNSENSRNLNLPMHSLRMLAAKSTPASARDAVLDLAANGEHITHAQVKDMIAQAKKETADDYEQRIADLKRRYDEQEARLRQDLTQTVEPVDLAPIIDEALAPLLEKIKRLEEERDRRYQAKPKRPDPYGTQAATIINALHYLAEAMTIDWHQFMEHQRIVADATQQPLKTVMAECLRNVCLAHNWLSGLIESTRGTDLLEKGGKS